MKKYISPQMEVFEMAVSASLLALSDPQTPTVTNAPSGASEFLFDDEEELVE